MLALPVFLLVAWVLSYRYGAAPMLLAVAAVLLVFYAFYFEGAYSTYKWTGAVAFTIGCIGVLAAFAAVIVAISNADSRRRAELR